MKNAKLLLLCFLLHSLWGAALLRAQNLLPNGGFEDALTSWYTAADNGSEATFTVITDDVVEGNSALKVDVITPGANAYDVQAINNAWPSEVGKTYTLTFWAKTETTDATFKAVQQIGDSYAEQIFTPTDSWQEYSWTFTALAAGLEFKLHFPDAGTFYVDGFTVLDPDGGEEPITEELVLNGGFEEGEGDNFTNWTLLAGDGVATLGEETEDVAEGNRALRVMVEELGSNPWEIQAINDAWASQVGEVYTLTFRAKANAADASFKVVQQIGDSYAEQVFTVTDTWQEYSWTFTALAAGLELKFQFLSTNTFYVDETSILGEISEEPPRPPYTPTGDPIAQGQEKFLGNVYSSAQRPYFENYWNQVTPENAGKWGSVESVRDSMNWTQLDSAYSLAKDNGWPFHFHVLVWGSQQPNWLEDLTPAEQREEIEEWFSLVAERYPDIEYLEVVNEPLHQPPGYAEALGGDGASGWDWIITSFRLARQYFADDSLMMNDYSIVNDDNATQTYLEIIDLLQAEDLIDIIGVQGHAFSTRGPISQITSNLDALGATGLPIQVTELDIDGPTDEVQLQDYQRIFPAFWEHPSVMGITLWGWKPGHWRTAQGAYIALENGFERPALVWLREYVSGYSSNQAPVADFTATPTEGYAPLVVSFYATTTTDADAGDSLSYAWDFGDGTVAEGVMAEHTYTGIGDYTAILTVTDGQGESDADTTMISVASPLKVQYKVLKGHWLARDPFIWPFLRIVNEGTTEVPYDEIVVRYWYTREYKAYQWGSQKAGQKFRVDYANIGRNKVKGSFVELADPVDGADHYLEMSFTSKESLVPGANSGTILTRSYNGNLSLLDERDDYSYGPDIEEFTDWEQVTLYRKNEDGSLQLLWGTEPGGAANARTLVADSNKLPEETVASVAADRWTVYPNPATGGAFTVEIPGWETEEGALLQVVTLEGKEVIRKKLSNRLEVDSRSLTPGIYFVRMISNQGTQVKKLQIK